jgi:hypothetical protein
MPPSLAVGVPGKLACHPTTPFCLGFLQRKLNNTMLLHSPGKPDSQQHRVVGRPNSQAWKKHHVFLSPDFQGTEKHHVGGLPVPRHGKNTMLLASWFPGVEKTSCCWPSFSQAWKKHHVVGFPRLQAGEKHRVVTFPDFRGNLSPDVIAFPDSN